MTPGDYIRAARQLTTLSIDDVALRVETDPPVSAARRAEWLKAMEEGTLPVRITTAAALHAIPQLRIDMPVLAKLIEEADAGPMLVRFRPAASVAA